jgi:hypothetical protein
MQDRDPLTTDADDKRKTRTERTPSAGWRETAAWMHCRPGLGDDDDTAVLEVPDV